MILRSYTYLRDARAKGFTDDKLIGVITNKLQELTYLLTEARLSREASGNVKPPREWAWTHCHSELHDGGSASCVLKDFKTKVA
jgi:hypothetical protein